MVKRYSLSDDQMFVHSYFWLVAAWNAKSDIYCAITDISNLISNFTKYLEISEIK